jgi:hypothetical protein
VDEIFESDEDVDYGDTLSMVHRASPKDIIAALQAADRKSYAELSATLRDCRTRIEEFSESDIKKILNTSLQIYVMFINSDLWKRCSPKLQNIVAKSLFFWITTAGFPRNAVFYDVVFLAYTLAKEEAHAASTVALEVVGSMLFIPTPVVLALVLPFSKEASEAVTGLMLECISNALLTPNPQKETRDKWLCRLNVLESDLIKRCLKLNIKRAENEHACVLGVVYDEDFSRYPHIQKAMDEIKTERFEKAIAEKERDEFEELLKSLNPKIPGDLKQLQILIRRLVDIIEKVAAKNTYENMLEECLFNLMRFSKPEEGLKLEAKLLRRCLIIINNYVSESNMRYVFETTLPSSEYTMLSYIRRTVGDFEGMGNLQNIIVSMNVTRLEHPPEYLRTAIKKGFLDMQGMLRTMAYPNSSLSAYGVFWLECWAQIWI